MYNLGLEVVDVNKIKKKFRNNLELTKIKYIFALS